jgi:hypothetical protein
MLRKLIRATMFAAFGMVAIVLTFGASIAQEKKDEPVPTIKDIMTKGHAKTDGYIAKIREAAKEGKWDDAKEYAKTLAFFGENLGKNKAPTGEAASWEKLTKKYSDNTKITLKGAEDKDEKAVTKGLGGINCMECHDAHRAKKKK